jgi:hypothetical protein
VGVLNLEEERRMFARRIPFVLLLVSSSAMAFDTTKLGQFGTLGLDEMMSLIDKSPQLKREVIEAVAKTLSLKIFVGDFWNRKFAELVI